MLGAILRAEVPDTLDRVLARLGEQDFFSDYHRAIYRAITALHEEGQPADLITLAPRLDDAGELQAVGGRAYLAQLFDDGAIPAHLDGYISDILRDSGARLGLAALEVALDRVRLGEPLGTVTAGLVEHLEWITARGEPEPERRRPQPRPLAEVLRDYEDSLGVPETDFVSYGVPEIDDRLGGGSLRGEVVLIGGTHSAGKTAFAVQVAALNARRGHRVLILSREMADVALGRRLIAQDARVDAKALRRRVLDQGELRRVGPSMLRLSTLPIWLDDTTASLAGIRRVIRAGQYRLVVVDYLQLVEPPAAARGNRRLEVTEISRALKRMAKRERCTILAVSSLSRLPVERGKKQPPQTSNLKESGDLEFDADVVMLLHWPDTTKSEREVILGKVREGETGGAAITLDYMPTWVRFTMQDEPDVAAQEEVVPF